MIDLEEPGKVKYSEREERILKEQFVLLLHTLLLLYLGLHNLLIPVISNLLKSQNVLTDVHFWSLFQIPVQILLRKKRSVPPWYFYFLVLGSVGRLGIEVYVAETLKSWSMLSVLVSELSSIVFYSVLYPMISPGRFSSFSVLGPLMAGLLTAVELHSKPTSILSQEVPSIHTSANLGCRGSEQTLKFPRIHEQGSADVIEIKDCGLSTNQIITNGKLTVINTTSQLLNLRLYKLSVLHGRVKWKFVRLVQVPGAGSWMVTPHIKNDMAYLIKSPEKRNLGHVLILPSKQREFPLGKGTLSVTYDTLSWSSHE